MRSCQRWRRRRAAARGPSRRRCGRGVCAVVCYALPRKCRGRDSVRMEVWRLHGVSWMVPVHDARKRCAVTHAVESPPLVWGLCVHVRSGARSSAASWAMLASADAPRGWTVSSGAWVWGRSSVVSSNHRCRSSFLHWARRAVVTMHGYVAPHSCFVGTEHMVELRYW